MAIGIYFPVRKMTAEKYNAVNEALEAAGQANPPGRTFHCGFHAEDGIHVFDVWESEEKFAAFGEVLMPLLEAQDVHPGEPRIMPVERIVT